MVRDIFQLNTFYKKAIVILSTALCSVLVMYGVLAVQTYARAVDQDVLKQRTADMAASVSTLEHDYMDRMDLLTLDDAHVRGFVDTDVSLFVARQNTHTLTLHDSAY